MAAGSGTSVSEGGASGDGVLAPDLKLTPSWWEDAAPPEIAGAGAPPERADVAVIGSGYTGLNAALVTVRAGRETVVLDAEAAGWGCSTRNGGQISTSIKPGLDALARRHGQARARAIHEEGKAALDWIEALVEAEGIDCDFRRAGRFHAAHCPAAYAALTARVEADRALGIESRLVPRAEQRAEIGSDAYHGGVVYPRHAALHPAKYHAGLLARAQAAGARVVSHCPVLEIAREGRDFVLRTPGATLRAREVIVATNGYTGALVPWLARRILPIGSYVIATEPLPRETVARLFPTDRNVTDTCRVIYYYRASPDGRRVIFGGRVSAAETDPRVSGPRLHSAMTRIFPELAGTRVSHSWLGMVAYSFDSLAHTGVHEGIHYAISYCGSGVSMASYLGMRVGQRLIGSAEGRTAFDDLPFPTPPLYTGRPWFLPAVVAWYRWRDRVDWRRAAA